MNRLCSKYLIHHYQFFKNRAGAVTVEIAIAFIPLILLLLYIIELGCVFYLSASIDLVMVQSARYTSAINKTAENNPDYQAIFEKHLMKNINFLPLLGNYKNLTVAVKFCQTIDEINNNSCGSIAEDRPIALYRVIYDYQPIFLAIPETIITNGFTRTLAYVQESERIRGDE